MKSRIILSMFAAALFLPACVHLETAERWAGVTETIVRTGAAIDLMNNPEHRLAYEQTRDALATLDGKTSLSLTDLQQALATVPVETLASGEGFLIVSGVDTLLRVFGYGEVDLEKSGNLQLFVTAMRNGLDQALAMTAAEIKSTATKALAEMKAKEIMERVRAEIDRIRFENTRASAE